MIRSLFRPAAAITAANRILVSTGKTPKFAVTLASSALTGLDSGIGRE